MCSWVCPDINKNRETLVKSNYIKEVNWQRKLIGKEVKFDN